jgi:hypothetical protein
VVRSTAIYRVKRYPGRDRSPRSSSFTGTTNRSHNRRLFFKLLFAITDSCPFSVEFDRTDQLICESPRRDVHLLKHHAY